MELDISKLSAEELAKLEKQLKESKKAEKEKQKQDVAALVTMENEAITELFKEAQDLSNAIVVYKRKFIELVEPLIKMKIELKKAAENQGSYSFRTKDKKVGAKISYNTTSRYDDEIQAAVDYAKKWLEEQITDDKTLRLVELMRSLLSKGEKGSYSAEKLLEFIKAAKEMDEPLLLKAAEAIENSIYKDSTSVSVSFTYKDNLGIERQLPLSATKA